MLLSKFNLQRLSGSALGNAFGSAASHWVAPLLILTTFMMAILAGKAVRSLSSVAAHAVYRSSALPKVAKNPISDADYQLVVKVLTQANPDVKVSAVNHKLIVSVAKPENLPEWLYAMHMVPSIKGDVIWDASTICVMTCSDLAASAEVTGFRQTFGTTAN